MRKEREHRRNVTAVIPCSDEGGVASLRGAQRRGNPFFCFRDGLTMDCFVVVLLLLAMTVMVPGTAFAACSSPAGVAGTTFYNATSNVPQYCDGTNWIAMGPLNAGAGSGGCSNPTANEGVLMYSEPEHVLQYCDGAAWIAVGPQWDEAEGVSRGGLVGHWKLDETSGNFLDSSGNNYTGSQYNGVSYASSGVINLSAGFDGSDDYIGVPDGAQFDFASKKASFSVWFKADPTQPETYVRFMDHFISTAGWYFGFDVNSQKVQFEHEGSGDDLNLTSTLNYNDGQWHHAVAVMDGSVGRLYIDGQFDVQDTYSGLVDHDPTNLDFGGNSTSNSFLGALDDLRIYNRVLSASEIQSLYDASSQNVGLVGWWKLDDGAGTTATDSSGNGNNGTLVNSPIWTSGVKSGALYFESAHVSISSVSALNNVSAFTISGWFRDTDHTVNGRPLGQSIDGTHDINIATWNSQGYLYFELGNGSNSFGRWTSYSSTIPEGEWWHGAFVFDGTGVANADRMKIYVNGVNRVLTFNNTIPATSPNNSAANFWIGDDEFQLNPFKGAVDDVRIYNRVLTAAEIQKLYGCTAPAYIEGTIFFNSSSATMQYCGGSGWTAIGK